MNDEFHQKCDKNCFSAFLSNFRHFFDYWKMPRYSKRILHNRSARKKFFDKQLQKNSRDSSGKDGMFSVSGLFCDIFLLQTKLNVWNSKFQSISRKFKEQLEYCYCLQAAENSNFVVKIWKLGHGGKKRRKIRCKQNFDLRSNQSAACNNKISNTRLKCTFSG